MTVVQSLEWVPLTFDPVMRMMLSLVLMLVMFSVAVGLRAQDFILVFRKPRQILIGTAAQVVALPLFTILLIGVLSPPASIALGMIIVASCPGGNVSNFYTQISGGDTAYSVTLTAISTVLAAFMIPVSVLFWSQFYEPVTLLIDRIEINRLGFLLQTVAILGLPLLAGMYFSNIWPGRAARMRRWLTPLSLILLMAVIVVGLISNWSLLIDYGHVLVPIVAIHNGLAFLLGALIGAIAFMTRRERRALTFEVGIQNAGIGLVILLTQFEGVGGAAQLAALWGVWHFVGGFAVLGIYKAVSKRARV